MTSGDDRAKVASQPASPVDTDELAEALEPLAYHKRLELLGYLTEPHYLEEIASHLGMSRQAAEKHVGKLLDIGVIEKQQGQRPSGPVVEYVVVRQRLFALSEEFAKLGVLQPESQEALHRTQAGTVPPEGEGRPEVPALTVAHGMHRGRSYLLHPPPGPWTIGRDPDRDIELGYDPYVSNQHAEVQHDEGAYVLVDTYSTNGTFLNGVKLDRGESRGLRPGDLIGVGKSLLVFRS